MKTIPSLSVSSLDNYLPSFQESQSLRLPLKCKLSQWTTNMACSYSSVTIHHFTDFLQLTLPAAPGCLRGGENVGLPPLLLVLHLLLLVLLLFLLAPSSNNVPHLSLPRHGDPALQGLNCLQTCLCALWTSSDFRSRGGG